MIRGLLAILPLIGIPVFGHRLDEYLQATTISLENDSLHAQMRLTPGVAVFPFTVASIDTNADGVISEAEQRAYAMRVLGDLSLTIDGRPLRLRLSSSRFAEPAEMKQGLGEIQLDFEADVPRSGGGSHRRLVFENHHQPRIGAYLINCLVPRDPGIRVTGQNRSADQSLYQLDYSQERVRPGPLSGGWWLWGVVIALSARFAWLWRSSGSGDGP